MAGTVHSLENPQLVEQVEQEAAQAARQLAEAAHLRRGQIVGEKYLENAFSLT